MNLTLKSEKIGHMNKITFKEKFHIFCKDVVKHKELLFIAIPVILYYVIFCYGPMYGALIAFKDFSPSKGVWNSPFVGLKHFHNLFSNPYFPEILRNTLVISLSTLIFGFPAPIILALLLNEMESVKLKKVIQNFTYLPHFISLVVVCGMIKTFTAETGLVTYIMTLFGAEAKSLLIYPKYFVPIYVISGIWQEVGWGSIIYIAALTNIDVSLVEAAEVDGAGRWKQFLHITIPCITPTIVIMLLLKVGSIINVGYEKIILLYNDSTMEVADVINTYSYRMGLLNRSWSFSSAVGLFNSVISFILVIATNSISRKLTETSLW